MDGPDPRGEPRGRERAPLSRRLREAPGGPRVSFVGRSEAERRAMLERIGAASIEDLWGAIPAEFRVPGPLGLPAPLAEYEVARRFEADAARNADANRFACFLGAGIYDHFIPSAVRALTSRAEFATAYTPYQPEVAQGTLQVIFEYQSMIRELTGMDVANASLYDGASAVVEAGYLARNQTGRKGVVVAGALHPHYEQALGTFLGKEHMRHVAHDSRSGTVDPGAL